MAEIVLYLRVVWQTLAQCSQVLKKLAVRCRNYLGYMDAARGSDVELHFQLGGNFLALIYLDNQMKRTVFPDQHESWV